MPSFSFLSLLEFSKRSKSTCDLHNALVRIVCEILVTDKRQQGYSPGPRTRAHRNPNKVHEKVVEPEVIALRPAERHSMEIEVEHARGVVKDISVDLTQ